MGYGEFWSGHGLTGRTVSYGLGGTREILMDSSALSSIMEVVLWAVNLPPLFTSTIITVSYFWWIRRWNFGCFNFSTYESIAKVARVAEGKKRWIFKVIFAAIRGHKNRIIVFNDIIKIWVVGSGKHCTVVGFLVLAVASVFYVGHWKHWWFVLWCSLFCDHVARESPKFISALFKIVIGGADKADS